MPLENSIPADSVSQTITKMQTQINLLLERNTVLSDSLSIMNKTLMEAKIKSGFFGDQLSFQLWWFSAILSIIALASWGWYLAPMRRSLTSLDIKTNSLKGDIDKSVENFSRDLKLQWKKAKKSITETNILMINQMYADSVDKKKHDLTIFLGVTLASFEILRPEKDQDIDNAFKKLASVFSLLDHKDLDIKKLFTRDFDGVKEHLEGLATCKIFKLTKLAHKTHEKIMKMKNDYDTKSTKPSS